MEHYSGAVLVPLDLSELSAQAIGHGARMAEALGVGLLLFTAVSGAEGAALKAFATGESITLDVAADAYLKRAASSVSSDVDIEVHHQVAQRAASAIVSFAAQHGVSMIVMTSHGDSGLDRWLLGGTALKVVESATVPVLIVPVRD